MSLGLYTIHTRLTTVRLTDFSLLYAMRYSFIKTARQNANRVQNITVWKVSLTEKNTIYWNHIVHAVPKPDRIKHGSRPLNVYAKH